MCGILLIISKTKLNKIRCSNAEKFIKSRGPDITVNSYFKKNIFLSNSILSINGKLKDKTKIIKSSNNRYHLSYNGEIYNFDELIKKFKLLDIKNDTQLLANLFEKTKHTKISTFLDGMFAYCCFDSKNKKIFISSDPQGEKKLFYYKSKNLFIVSSNINSIINFIKKDELDVGQIYNYLNSRHFILKKNTIFKNIKIFDPGCNFEFQVNNFSLKKKYYADPINWISKRKYLENKSKNKNQLESELIDLLNYQAKIMVPEKKFGSILSGGIDSTLQTYLISRFKMPESIASLNHIKKDKVSAKVKYFQKYINNKIYKIDIDKKKYLSDLKKCYSISCMPFLTHDFVGKYQISKFFKNKKLKVFFSADGVDELFGGYELYKEVKWKTGINSSPYTKSLQNKDQQKDINKIWLKAYRKYSNFLDKKEATIQASLFTDYFIQSVYVGNIGTDIMCSYNGIESRNIFIQKKIIKFALNLPLKYKINFNEKNKKFILKSILKKIFKRYFSEKLIFKKQGFSGFPNSSISFLKNKKFNHINKYINISKLKKNKAMQWKLLNLEFFLKFNKKKII